MKLLRFLVDLPIRFISALFLFTLGGWIGWLGIVLVALRFFDVIHWPWWLAALPLEYGVIYCLYMTVDGALYRAGLKKSPGDVQLGTHDKSRAFSFHRHHDVPVPDSVLMRLQHAIPILIALRDDVVI